MQSRIRICTTALSLCSALAIPLSMVAQENEGNRHKPKHHMYRVIDLGTLGGPNGYFATEPIVQAVNELGTVVGAADIPGQRAVPLKQFRLSISLAGGGSAVVSELRPGCSFPALNGDSASGRSLFHNEAKRRSK